MKKQRGIIKVIEGRTEDFASKLDNIDLGTVRGGANNGDLVDLNDMGNGETLCFKFKEGLVSYTCGLYIGGGSNVCFGKTTCGNLFW